MMILWPYILIRGRHEVMCSIFPGFLWSIAEPWVRATVGFASGYIYMDWLGEGGRSLYDTADLKSWLRERFCSVEYNFPPGCVVLPCGSVVRLVGQGKRSDTC